MPDETQRFCPLCDRPFEESEAVLRCQGCGVLHHPACWVRVGGCSTQRQHDVVPAALAYTTTAVAEQAPHPGEGTRRFERPGVPALPPNEPDSGLVGTGLERPASPPPRPSWRPQPEPPSEVVDRRKSMAQLPPPPDLGGPVQHGRYAVRATAEGKPLPEIYGRHRYLRFWYFPAGALVALIVAGGVVWAAAALFGGDSDDSAPATPIPTAINTEAPPPTAPPTSEARPTVTVAGPSPTPSLTGKFRFADVVVVTGAGDCLNVRVAPGRTNDAIVCLQDGREMTVSGGPETADGLRWWKVKTTLGEGWAAEDFMTRKP